MFEYNGKTYTLEQLQNVAKQKGYTFDELLNKNPNIKELGKTTPTSTGADVEETAAPDMDSKSVNTSLGLTNVLPENQKFDALGRIVDINTNEVIESTRPVDFGETVPAQVAENILLNIERLSTIDNSIGAVAGALLNKPNFFKKQLAKIEASEKRSEKLGGRGFTDISEATSISEGIGDVISGISSAFASFGASGLEIAAGGPLLLAADMASKSIIDANKIKADAAGTTIEILPSSFS